MVSAPLLAVLVTVSGAWAESTPRAVLGWPGTPYRALLSANGTVRAEKPAIALSEGLAAEKPSEPSGEARLNWLRPGVRAVKATREADGLEIAAVSGVAPYGRPALAPWLFRAVSVTNSGQTQRRGRLCVEARFPDAPPDLAVQRAGDVSAGGRLRLSVSRALRDAKVTPETGEVLLGFDFDLAPSSIFEILLAAPGSELPLDAAPSERHALTPGQALDALTTQWCTRAAADTVALGDALVNEAYHAAVGTLLLSPPQEASASDLAAWLSALARARQGPTAEGIIEALLRGQDADGAFRGASDPEAQAALTRALAEYALYSDAPPRWAAVLWPSLRRAAGRLLSQPRTPLATEALARAAEVARLAGQVEAAASWAREARSSTAAAPVDWERTEEELRAQPLPGVRMSEGAEDRRYAERLVTAVADSLTRLEGGTVFLLPGLPPSPQSEGPLLELRQFPSGAGPLSLTLTRDRRGRRLTLDPLALPRDAAAIRLYPPAGMTASRVRVDDKRLTPEAFGKGPPWEISPRAERVVIEG